MLGQTSDYPGFDLVVADNLPQPSVLLADRGYDVDGIGKPMDSRDVLPVISMRKSRKKRVGVNGSLYRLRNLVERCFNNKKVPAVSPQVMTRLQKATLASSTSHRSASGRAICQLGLDCGLRKR